jgi:hypothetical protein
MGGELHGPGWWVGSDGDWHPPEEDFDADVPSRKHPLRRLAVVLLAVAVVGATTVGAWLGTSQTSGSSSSSGPSLVELTAQIRQVVSGTAAGGLSVAGVSSVACTEPASWSSGKVFRCEVYGPQRREIGVYTGTVAPTTSSGYWRWDGRWEPNRSFTSTA